MSDAPELPRELRGDHVPVSCHGARDAETRAAIEAERARRALRAPATGGLIGAGCQFIPDGGGEPVDLGAVVSVGPRGRTIGIDPGNPDGDVLVEIDRQGRFRTVTRGIRSARPKELAANLYGFLRASLRGRGNWPWEVVKAACEDATVGTVKFVPLDPQNLAPECFDLNMIQVPFTEDEPRWQGFHGDRTMVVNEQVALSTAIDRARFNRLWGSARAGRFQKALYEAMGAKDWQIEVLGHFPDAAQIDSKTVEACKARFSNEKNFSGFEPPKQMMVMDEAGPIPHDLVIRNLGTDDEPEGTLEDFDRRHGVGGLE